MSRRALVAPALLLAALAAGCATPPPPPTQAAAQPPAAPPPEVRNDSGGPLLPEQAAYDVGHVDLALSVDPAAKSIAGTATLELRILSPLSSLLLDLDRRLTVTAVRASTGGAEAPAAFEHRDGRLRIALGREVAAGGSVRVAVDYHGSPREAKKAPWDGAFTWAKTKAGQPWIATSVEGEGGDMWWPCRDHPSDKPDSFALHIRVPAPLVVASNGRLERVEEHGDGTRTYHWRTAYPISNYNIALNIAPYETVTASYTSVTGEVVPATFWFVPEDKAQAERIFPEMLRHLRFYERTLGPYPFRREKYGVAETPHLGMEHQSIIAYGNKFRPGPHGFDWLHHHELGHEWWGNLVTAPDWSDFWIHEGLCTYMQALYAEEREGVMAYHHTLYEHRRLIKNKGPVAPVGPTPMSYMDDEIGTDVYYKGEWIIHMVRYLIGRDDTLRLLRRFAYPTETAELAGDGSACRFATTADFIAHTNRIAGRDLTWLLNLYLRQPALPELLSTYQDGALTLRWKTPDGYPFPMPVEVEVNGASERVPMPDGQAVLRGERYRGAKLDPDQWILKQPRVISARGETD